MGLHKKLDFLMNITKTSNSSLALYTSLDPSYISRLRRGERKLIKDADYLKKMAVYFSKQCVEEYQKKALLEALQKPAELLFDSKRMTEQLYHWLLEDNLAETASITGFLDGLSAIRMKKMPVNESKITPQKLNQTQSDVSLYFGIEGKREAVIRFLSNVVEAKEQQTTLYLYSDEPMDWLLDDLSFSLKWANLLARVVGQGNRIKIIHTVSRNLNEMLEALTKWMPLYMTGAIDPYYYPKKRDGIFKRTLFIAPKNVAVTSTSIEPMTKQAVNIVLKDADAIDALTEELKSYLSLCKPLMRIFTDKDKLHYLETLEEFEREPADAIIRTGHLSLATMPFAVAEAIASRSAVLDQKELKEYFLKRKEGFEHSLYQNRFYEIIRLPELTTIQEGRVKVQIPGISESFILQYRPEEYRMHLENIILLLQNFENYQISLQKNLTEDGFRLYSKEDLGTIVVKTTPPHAIFAINESNMTAAFWDYLNMLYYENKPNKKRVIKELQDLADGLK